MELDGLLVAARRGIEAAGLLFELAAPVVVRRLVGGRLLLGLLELGGVLGVVRREGGGQLEVCRRRDPLARRGLARAFLEVPSGLVGAVVPEPLRDHGPHESTGRAASDGRGGTRNRSDAARMTA